jgi:hypothetical protein
MKITEKTFDLVTGETIITERDETAAETQIRIQHETEAAAQLAAQAEAEAAKAAAQAKLTALGLTADDLKALGLGGN